MTTIVFSQDLLLTSQVTQTAASLDQRVETVSSAAELIARCRAGEVAQVVLDLSTPQLDPAQLVQELQAIPRSVPRLIAVGPHVHTSRLEAARAAGCRLVVTRGQFHREMGRLLQRENPHPERGTS